MAFYSKFCRGVFSKVCHSGLSMTVKPRSEFVSITGFCSGEAPNFNVISNFVRFTSSRPMKCEADSFKEENEWKRSYNISIMFVPAIFNVFLGSDKTEGSTPETDLINHIKRSLLLAQTGETEKAEQVLHLALKMAQDLRHEKGITYVYDTMANLAFESGHHEKAQRLFVEVLRRLIASGLPTDDMIVINISLKIADTFLYLGDDQKGEQGFLFCLDTLKKKISSGASDQDTLVLYSQALDRYSLFLQQTGRLNEAIKNIELAVEVAESVFGDLNNKVGAILLSDMGVIKTAAGDKDAANRCFDKALDIAKQKEVDTSAAVIMVNRGLALKESGLMQEANKWCEMGLTLALQEQNKALRKAAEECLKADIKDGNRRSKERAQL